MHDPRTSIALPQLVHLGREHDPPRWVWSIVHLDARGRLPLPHVARDALGLRAGERTERFGLCNQVAMVLQRGGAGAPIPVDGRGRLSVPAWMRRGPGASAVVGSRAADGLVVMAAATALDGLGVLTGRGR